MTFKETSKNGKGAKKKTTLRNQECEKKGYQESGLVVVLYDVGQALSNELRFHLLTTHYDLHPRLQVQNTTIHLQP